MLKILVVEDEVLIAMALCKNLQRVGYHVAGPVATGEQAIQWAASEQPDIILMDISLASAMNGIQAAQQIRAFSQAPIIFVTGYSDKSLRDRGIELQPATYLKKPVEVYTLEPLFHSLLAPISRQV